MAANIALADKRDVSAERILASILSERILRSGAVTLRTVIQVYAHKIVALLDDLRTLERQCAGWDAGFPSEKELHNAKSTIGAVIENCRSLELSSANKQIKRIGETAGNAGFTGQQMSLMLAELRTRINEDLEDRVFFCVPDRVLVERFFKECTEDGPLKGMLVQKQAHEIFDQSVVRRFPAAIDDIEEASRCFVSIRYTACVFHLMRIVEVGVRSVARLSGIADPKPSWGAVLQKIEKYAFRTEYKDLPAEVQPHIALLKDLLPRMQAIQHAWRNKVSHVEDKIIPSETGITQEIANEIMVATQAFMRKLAADLP